MSGIRENVLGAVLEAAPDAMLAVDRDGIIVAANGLCEKMFGYGHGALFDKRIEILVPEGLRARHVIARLDFAATRHARNPGLEVTGLRREGTEIRIAVTLTPVDTAEGLLTIAAIVDRSDQHARTLRLQEAARQQTRFLAGMSHQLRTPLNAIVGFSELACQGQMELSAAQRAHLDKVLIGARQLLQMLDDVLAMASFDIGRLSPDAHPLKVADLLDDACDSQGAALAQKAIAVRVEFEPVTDIVSDRKRIRQVYGLLLAHAAAVTPVGGSVTLRIGPDGEQRFRIEVQHPGQLLPAEELDEQFVEFHRPSPAAEQETVLALPLARRIVEALGGRIGALADSDGSTILRAVLPRRIAAH